MLLSLISFVVGLVTILIYSVVKRRLLAGMELGKIRNNLASLVQKNERLNSLFPPSFLSDIHIDISSGVSRVDRGDWKAITEGAVSQIQKQLVRRVTEKKGSREFETAMKYSMGKFGKMIRSRLVVLLGLALDKGEADGGELGRNLIKLAQVGELIHGASLLHDDVVDEANTRRGAASHRAKFGDLTAVLTGDNLVALMVEVLVEINCFEVTQKISLAIESLVIGELLQLGNQSFNQLPQLCAYCPPEFAQKRYMFKYIGKSYFKTASLFSALMQSVSLLTKSGSENLAGAFGFYFGVAFQLIDDVLDFEISSETAGKPVGGSDVANGTATLPVLLAAEDEDNLSVSERFEMETMIKRRFQKIGDLQRTLHLLGKSNGIQKAKNIIQWYICNCENLIEGMISEESEYFSPLITLIREYSSLIAI